MNISKNETESGNNSTVVIEMSLFNNLLSNNYLEKDTANYKIDKRKTMV